MHCAFPALCSFTGVMCVPRFCLILVKIKLSSKRNFETTGDISTLFLIPASTAPTEASRNVTARFKMLLEGTFDLYYHFASWTYEVYIS